MQRLLLNAQQYSHHLLNNKIKAGDYVIDATMGNGHDTLFLAELVGENGKVFAFDIQDTALSKTKEKLEEKQFLKRCALHLLGHQFLDTVIPLDTHISAAIFNLGYLPGSDKTVITNGQSTIDAIQHILPRLKQNGLIILVIYYGHEGGTDERQQLLDFVSQLSQKEYATLSYQFINQVNSPPQLLVIEKLIEKDC